MLIFSYTHINTKYINTPFLSQSVNSDGIINGREHIQSSTKQRVKQTQEEHYGLLGHNVVSLGNQIQFPSDAVIPQKNRIFRYSCNNLKTQMSGMCCAMLAEVVVSTILTKIFILVLFPSPTLTHPSYYFLFPYHLTLCAAFDFALSF
jgi:hypothetical protein